ncbi:hypothetical protein VB854_04170 [Limnoraphis robusta CCNP1315]|uniref:Uncharacterized protein n=1 Tax=Limnoraphis robusta CCNP1315 TaxID=3110306 RepID=A0ABU5TTX0_9CYAN|nr:hypothetical protein [Limnoraphis robusta CCNP1315]MEA5543414.1 hypothetical protein [Limnoraphis robusta CCNP1324]
MLELVGSVKRQRNPKTTQKQPKNNPKTTQKQPKTLLELATQKQPNNTTTTENIVGFRSSTQPTDKK